MVDRVSVTVVGAGIIGLTAAIKLARRGAWVTVVDRRSPGSGTSAAANGALTPYSDHSVHARVTEAAARSVDLYPEHLDFLREITDERVDCDQVGVLQVMVNEEDIADAKEHFQRFKANSWPVEWLDRGDVHHAEPRVTPDAIAGMLYSTEASIDIDQLLGSSVRALDRLGVTLSVPTTVVRISQSHTGRVVLSTDTGSFEADVVIVCSGADICQIDGCAIPKMKRIRGEILETWGPPGGLSHCIYWRNSFLTPKRDGRVLVGTSYIEHVPGMNEDTSTISVDGALKQLTDTVRIVPSLKSYELRRVWKSWRPSASDGLPLLGPCGPTSVLMATGFSGLGYTLAPFTAEYLADMVFEQSSRYSIPEFLPSRPDLEIVA